MEQIRSNGEQKELRDEIVDLGTRYGIVTPYTSYLATDGSEREGARGGNQVDTMVGGGRGRPKNSAPMKAADRATTGQTAVMASKDAKEKQDAIKDFDQEEDSSKAGTVKKVAARTFYLENGVWIDSEFKPESKLPEVKLTFASNEYFELITRETDLAKYFALGDQVVVVYKGKVYRVVK